MDVREGFLDVSERFIGVRERFTDVCERFIEGRERFIDVVERFLDVRVGIVDAREGVMDVRDGLAGVWELLGAGNGWHGRRRLVVYAAAGCLFVPSKSSVPISRKVLCEEVCSLNILYPPPFQLGVDID